MRNKRNLWVFLFGLGAAAAVAWMGADTDQVQAQSGADRIIAERAVDYPIDI
ncbi:MAG: hypothetical protein ACNA7E_00970 [Wenzhouxiangellaceae bacterium]